MASPRKRACVVAAAVGLIVLTLAVYHPVRHHEFLPFDDQTFLVENTHLESGLTADGLGWALGSSYDGSWIPVTWLSFLVDQEVHGLSAPGVHLVNVLIHAACSLLLFWLHS